MRAVQRKGRRADLFFIDHAADRFQTAWATLPPSDDGRKCQIAPHRPAPINAQIFP